MTRPGVSNAGMPRALLIAAAFFLLSIPLPGPASAQTKVDLELILLADGSGSVDDVEFSLQRLGTARALRHPRVVRAIQSGFLGQIALAYVEWSGPELHIPVVPWTLLRTPADVDAFAAKLETHPRELYGGGTAIGDAILHGVQSLQGNAFEARRRVIDISGDGPDRNGLPAAVGRDEAVKQGITVNGLPILEGRFGLDEFFRTNVIGGRGAFVIPARTFADFETAIRAKLIREIASLPHATP